MSFIGFIVTLITLLLLPVVHAQTVITHLSYPGHGDAWRNWVEERATAYERLNPGIEIEIMQSSGNAVDHFVALRAGGTLPDVSEMPITHGARFASEEYFLDLKPFVERDNTISLDMFVPITVDALTWTDNSLWGLPADVYVVPTYYNKGFFAEAGLASPNDLGDDWNWESVVSSGKKLTRDTNNDGQPERIAITGFSGMWSHMDVVRKAGGQLYDRYKDPTESLLNTPEVETGIQWLVDLYRVHGILERSWWAIRDGTGAMSFVYGPSGIRILGDHDIDFDIALQPKGPASRAPIVATNSFQITRGAENPQEAWDWIKFLVTNEQSSETYVAATSRFPAYMPTARAFSSYIANPPEHIGLILESALDPSSYHAPLGIRATEASVIINSYTNPLLNGEIDVRSMLEEAHRRVNAVLQGE